jgi:hypothetical protein
MVHSVHVVTTVSKTSFIEWNDFGRSFHQFQGRDRLLARSSQQRSGGIDAVDARHLPAIERQIQARPDPNLQHSTACPRHHPPPVIDEAVVGHREMGKTWQDMIAI